MSKLLIKQLVEFGLREKEAKIYLSLLELEVATASEVAKISNTNRSSTYVVLESLKKRGLVSIAEDKRIQQYVAVSPDLLLNEAQNKANKMEEIKNKISNIVPELKGLFKDTKQKPKVKVFEGRQGLISAFEDSLDNKEKLIRVSSAPGNLKEIIEDYLVQYVQKRMDLKIKMHGIHPDDKIHRGYIENSPRTIDTYLLIPKTKNKFPSDFAIWDDKIGFMSNQNRGIAIVIQSRIMAEVMKSIFDLAWERAKITGKEIRGYKQKK